MRRTWLALAFFALFLALLAVLSPAAHACGSGTSPTYDYLVDVRAACDPATGDCLTAFTHEHGFGNPVPSLNGAIVGRTRAPAPVDAPWLRPTAAAWDGAHFLILSADTAGIRLHRVGPAGDHLAAVPLADAPAGHVDGNLAAGPGGVLAVWSGTQIYAGDTGVYLVRIAVDGTSTPVVRIAQTGANPQVIAVGSGWLVDWTDGWAVHALSVLSDASTAALPDPVALRDGIGIGNARLALSAGQPLLAWDETDAGGSRIMASPLGGPSYAPTAPMTLYSVPADPTYRALPPWVEALDGDAAGFVVGWNDGDRLHATRVGAGGSVAPDKVLVTPAYASEAAQLVWDGARQLLFRPRAGANESRLVVATPLASDLAPQAEVLLVQGPSPLVYGPGLACAVTAGGRAGAPASLLLLVGLTGIIRVRRRGRSG